MILILLLITTAKPYRPTNRRSSDESLFSPPITFPPPSLPSPTSPPTLMVTYRLMPPPACIPVCLPACLLVCLLTRVHSLPAYLSACLSIYHPLCLSICLPYFLSLMSSAHVVREVDNNKRKKKSEFLPSHPALFSLHKRVNETTRIVKTGSDSRVHHAVISDRRRRCKIEIQRLYYKKILEVSEARARGERLARGAITSV